MSPKNWRHAECICHNNHAPPVLSSLDFEPNDPERHKGDHPAHGASPCTLGKVDHPYGAENLHAAKGTHLGDMVSSHTARVKRPGGAVNNYCAEVNTLERVVDLHAELESNHHDVAHHHANEVETHPNNMVKHWVYGPHEGCGLMP